MNHSENERDVKVIEEVRATLAAAADQLTNETEPAFVYHIEAGQDQPSGENE